MSRSIAYIHPQFLEIWPILGRYVGAWPLKPITQERLSKDSGPSKQAKGKSGKSKVHGSMSLASLMGSLTHEYRLKRLVSTRRGLLQPTRLSSGAQ